MERLIDDEEVQIFEIEPELFSIGTKLPSQKKTISLLNVGVSKIKNTKEYDPKQGTINQTSTKVLPLIMKLENFCVKPRVTLGNKVYPKT